MQNYSQGQYQGNSGFSNPFGPAVNPSQNMAGGYTAYNGFGVNNQNQNPQPQRIVIKPNTNLVGGGIRKSKITASTDGNPNKRCFRGKYALNAAVPIKYNTVDYFMLVENVRINNENALRELKRGKAKDILNQVMDSLEFLSYVHK